MDHEVGQTLDFIRRRRASYKNLMSVPLTDCLADLKKFCYAERSTFHADPRLHAVAEGRREVWLRIQQHLNLSSEELYEIFTGLQLSQTRNEDDA